jgi:hypothetical protein
VYFHDYVKYERRVELESENTEYMWFEIFPKHQKSFLLCFIYRPPNSNVSWYPYFDKELTNAFAKNDYVLIITVCLLTRGLLLLLLPYFTEQLTG